MKSIAGLIVLLACGAAVQAGAMSLNAELTGSASRSGLRLSAAAPAAAAADFDPAQWKALVEAVKARGTVNTQVGDGMEWHSLSHVVPVDISKPHQADYISTIGARDSQGNYDVGSLSVVSENWQRAADGNWHVDQWLWLAWPDGTLGGVQHNALVIEYSSDPADRYEGTVLSDDTVPVGDVTSPEQQAIWGKILSQWFGWAAR